MPAYFDIIENTKKYFAFSNEEIKWIIPSVFLIALIVGFDDGSQVFVWTNWIKNYLTLVPIVALALLVHLSVQRIYGIYMGFRIEHKFWIYGLLVGLLLAVMTYGKLAFIACSGIFLHLLEVQRLGKFRYGLSMWSNGWISLFGCLSNLAVAFIFKLLLFLPFTAIIQKIIFVNVLFAIWNMLPIPPLNGLNVFFASQTLYFVSFGLVIGFGLALIFLPIIYSIIFGVLSAIMFGIAYYLFITRTGS